MSSDTCSQCGTRYDRAHEPWCPKSVGHSSRTAPIRTFETGATRNVDDGKPDFEAAFSPLVFEAYGKYKIKHRLQADGSMRPDDNWQKGIPLDAYMKSGWRHHVDHWRMHREIVNKEVPLTIEHIDAHIDTLCASLFNTHGYLHELLKIRRQLT